MQEALYARLNGLYWVCAGLADKTADRARDRRRPSDRDASLQRLLFMARRVGDLALTMILTARPAGSGEWPEPLTMLAARSCATSLASA